MKSTDEINTTLKEFNKIYLAILPSILLLALSFFLALLVFSNIEEPIRIDAGMWLLFGLIQIEFALLATSILSLGLLVYYSRR